MILNKGVLGMLEASQKIRNLIAAACDVSEQSVRRWVSDNNVMLTTASALKVIREETGLKDSQILEEKVDA
jgi:hypothetical protein